MAVGVPARILPRGLREITRQSHRDRLTATAAKVANQDVQTTAPMILRRAR
jgi:hypothetical protein